MESEETFDSVLASHKYTREKFWATYYAFLVFHIIFIIGLLYLMPIWCRFCTQLFSITKEELHQVGEGDDISISMSAKIVFTIHLGLMGILMIVNVPSIIRPEFARALRAIRKNTHLKKSYSVYLYLFEIPQILFLALIGITILLDIVIVSRILHLQWLYMNMRSFNVSRRQ